MITQNNKRNALISILSQSGVTFGNKTIEESIAEMSDSKVDASLSYFIQEADLKNCNINDLTLNGPHPAL